jgi:hypothetical protein
LSTSQEYILLRTMSSFSSFLQVRSKSVTKKEDPTESAYPTPNNSTAQYDFLIAGSSIKLLLRLEVNNQHSQKT